MQSPAPFAFLKQRAMKNPSAHKKDLDIGLLNFEPDMDLNVFVLQFKQLKEAEKSMGAGDPFFCTHCKACLNKFSKIMSKQQYQEKYLAHGQQLESKEVKQEESPPKLLEIPKNGSAWICEFCNTHNTILIEKQEIPTKDDMVYMLQSFNQKMEVESDNASTVVFCIDNSGSMNSTTQITGKVDLKHGLSQAEIDMLKQFMEPGDEVQLNNLTGKTFVSRKQCVMAAIESQLAQITKNDPNKKVGLITFNNQVVIFGDCSKEPVNVLGDKLQKQEAILEDVTPLKIEKPVKDTYNKIIQNFNKIQASGATALGPAVLCAIELASKGKVGSTVVICTDGLANIGLGNFEGSLEDSKQFYATLAQKATSYNLAVNIVSIKGQGCKLEALGILAKQTNGNVSIVNPEDIENKFANFLKDEIVATSVQVKIRLHKAVQFRNQFPQNIHENGTLLVKNMANATVKTKISFQYQLKPQQLINQMGIDLKELKVLPFQSQIFYTTTEGHRFIRVVTSNLDTTTDKKLIEDKAQKLNVVHERMGQQTALMVDKDSLKGFQEYNNHYLNYVQKVANNEDNVDNRRHKAQTSAWNCQKNAKVMKAGLNRARKEEIKLEKSSNQPMSASKAQALMIEQKHIEMEEDEDMGGLFDNYK